MKNFFLVLFMYLLKKVYLDYEAIQLKFSENYFFLPLNFPNNNNKTSYVFSTFLPKSFFPSSNCTKCIKFQINETEFDNVHKNVSIPYYFYNFTGRLFKGNYSTDKYSSLNQEFLAFDNLSYEQNYSGYGRYSLSYLNYNFNTSKKLFAIKFNMDNAELHLGDYDRSRDLKDLKVFNIVTVYKYENYTETIIRENKSPNNFFRNNLLEEEDDKKIYKENITYEVDKSIWFMSFPKLKIRKEEDEEVDYPLENYKLTLDMSCSQFYIPKNFFIKNVQKIFPKEAKCQMARSGYFSCQCDEDFKTKFGNFKFISEKGVEFMVNVTDYMTYQSSISGSRCNVHLVINYENDLFIAGITVMNNYYNIFDIENKTFSILPREDENIKQTGKFILLFFIVLISAFVILFGGYYFYNKLVINNPTGLIQENNNNANENNIRQINNNIQRENEFQPNNEDQENIRNIGNYF